MNEIALNTSQSIINGDMFDNWISYIDASEKTVDTYTKNIRQFALYTAQHGITQPQRNDILEYREYLKGKYKPTTVQAYITAVKLFFKWTEQENLYPNIAAAILLELLFLALSRSSTYIIVVLILA